MKVRIGQSVGSFEITSVLGKGGMGEVWRASDLSLGREVALKILPEDFADDSERHARFEHEARVLASLNHQNIATLHALEHLDGAHVLVMELVEGEGLDERIRRGPIAVDDAIEIARQIALALEAAHERGIVHRDLKPANIRIRPDGTVKVLDFGLAKAWMAGGGSSSESLSPTMARNETAAGVLLGTAAYMSPEQARGKAVDRRSDIWSFGAVVWEMVTGDKLFAGETVSDVVAAVLTREPRWKTVKRIAGKEFARVLQGCLERDAGRRLGSAPDVALMLRRTLDAGFLDDAESQPEPAKKYSIVALLGVAGVMIGLAAVAAAVWVSATQTDAPDVARFSVFDPEIVVSSGIAVSPDGRRLAFVVDRDEGNLLALRSLDRFDPQVIPETEGAMSPFFSADGQWLGYFTRTELRKIPVAGGPSRTIAVFGSRVRFDPWNTGSFPTADWGDDDTIVFSSGFWREPATLTGLFVVAGSGGEMQALTRLDGTELGHQWPSFTPDGRHVVLTTIGSGPRNSHVDIVNRETGERRRLQEDATAGRVVPSGHLVFLDRFYSRLVAAAIDMKSLELKGAPIPLIEGVTTATSQSFAVSATGTLVYLTAGLADGDNRLVTVGLNGSVTALVGRNANWYQPRTSPDGRRLVIREVADECRLWLFDLKRKTLTPLTTIGDNHQPIWMRSGQELVYGREDSESGIRGLYRHVADGSRPPVEFLSGDTIGAAGSAAVPYPDSFSPNDAALLFEKSTLSTGSDLWVLPMGSVVPEPFLASSAFEGDGAFSPDGRWVAYVSDESGRQEVYVRAYPSKGGRLQISSAGGEWPIWSPDGSRLYYSQGRRLMVVDFAGAGFEAEADRPHKVLEGFDFGRGSFDIMPDGDSFVLVQPARQGIVEVRVVSNWQRELARVVPVGG